MNLMLSGEEVLKVKQLRIEIDLDLESTGKPCRVFAE